VPSIALPYLNIVFGISMLPSLSPRERELAILSVASYTCAKHCINDHRKTAVEVGLSESQVDYACKGKMPEGLTEREETAFVIAAQMVKLRGPLDDTAFEKAKSVFGREGLASLTHLVALYSYVSLVLNVGDVP
jgi:4-carboxymuconolactone decarboxylase